MENFTKVSAVAIVLPKSESGEYVQIGETVRVEVLSAHNINVVIASYDAELILNNYAICTKHKHLGNEVITPICHYHKFRIISNN